MGNCLKVFFLIALLSPPGVVCQTEKSAPKESAEFRGEISKLAAQGLRLKEAFEVQVEGTTRLLAAIFERRQRKGMEDANEFRIIESDGQIARTIFRRADFHFSFDNEYALVRFTQLNGTDINGDGLKEILVQSSSGGNCWSCNPLEIYRVKDHKAELIAAGPVQKIADLNGDGQVELVLTDARWENYDDFSHAVSPAATMVYTWKDGRYVYASRDFGAHHRAEIDRLNAVLDESKSQITEEIWSDEPYVGSACSIAISYAHLGEIERGLKEMEAAFGSNVRTQEQRKRRARILEDFRRGDSFQKLNDMKYGDAMPLG